MTYILHLNFVTLHLQEIRPYDTKTIARANFFGRVATNHTSFIRIKTGHTSSPSIVLPVEVEVSDSSRLYLSRELMDFGIVKSGGTDVYIVCVHVHVYVRL